MPSLPSKSARLNVLVAGATGVLGGQIVQELRSVGHGVRALTRRSSDPARKSILDRAGAELVVGDLRDPASIAAACSNVRVVVSTATALMSRAEGDSIESVDLRGQIDLIGAAERAGIGHFVYVSFPPVATDFAFQRAKRGVERRLQESGMSFTIIHAAAFAEIWFAPFLGFDPLHGRVRILGDGTRSNSWISIGDVARFAAAATEGGAFGRKTLSLGGPDALSYHDILELFAAKGARDVEKEYVPEAAIERQFKEATDPRQEAFAALMLSTARGQLVSSGEAQSLWSEPLTSMSDYVARVTARPQS